MSGLTFAVLGPLEVRRDGVPVAVPSGRRRVVLAALLARVGATVPMDVLVEAGWADDLPVEPKAALYTVVTRLRAVLGEGVLVAESGGYRLAVPPEAVDACRFERLCAEATWAGPEQAAWLLDRALGLWRGNAYDELADREITGIEAHRLDLLRADACEERARVALDLGDAAAAVRTLTALLSRHPFREQAIALLMNALTRAGRSADALACYDEYRQRMADELGLDPSPALEDLQTRVLRNDPVDPVRPPALSPSWVDTSTAMFGRDADLAALARAVAANRLVTVTGTGGVGKTRLVAQALPALAGRLGLPAVVVELAGVGHDGAESAIVEALGIRRETPSRAGLVDRLRAAPALLVLDNCEHLLGEVAGLADLLTRRCPRARVVATSRHRLGLTTEHVLRLEPLAAPRPGDPSNQAPSSAAVDLLVDRVRRVRPDGARADQADALTDIACLLDGLPLALELAASRVAALGAAAVRTALVRDLGRPGRATGESALRSLQEWSCRLLTDDERILLAALTVFAGDFDLAAATALASGLPRPYADAETTAMLTGLVDASLVVANPDGTSFRLLAVVRSEVDALLNTPDTRAAARRAHARWAATCTARIAHACTGRRAGAALGRLHRVQSDLVAAIGWALSADELESAAAITGAVEQCPHWTPRADLAGLIVEVGERCQRGVAAHATEALGAAATVLALRGDLDRATRLGHAAAARAATPAELYLAHLALGLTGLYRGDPDVSRRHWQAIADVPDMPLALAAEAHSSLALLACYTGELETAGEQGRIAMLLAETAGSVPVHAFATYASGEAAAATPDRSIRLLTTAAGEAATVGATHIQHVATVAVLAALVRTGEHERARTLAATILPAVRAVGGWPQLWTALRIIAELMSALGRAHDAALVLACADTHPSAPPPLGADVARYRDLQDALRTRLGTQVFDQIRIAAHGCSREEIADRVLALLAGDQLTTAAPHRS